MECIEEVIIVRNCFIRSFGWIILVAVLVAVGLGGPAIADSWGPPKDAQYFSANRAFRFDVMPDRDAKPEKPAVNEESQKTSGPTTGKLWRIAGAGVETEVWSKKLVNPDCPVSVIVSDHGRFTVTFDDWGRIGNGDNVVVIYDAQGNLVKKLGLEAFLSAEEINGLDMSISSRMWRDTARFDEENSRLILSIRGQAASRLEKRIDLTTGSPIPAHP
jgi:hypothetical protein